MQETRKYILEILKVQGHATVEEIVAGLKQRRGNITSVTVRHHLLRLQKEGLIATPELRRKVSPGRPQHVYALTDKAQDQFPGNYQRLAAGLIEELSKQLPPSGVNVILEGVADQMAFSADLPDCSLEKRIEYVSHYLTEHGYDAHWERVADGYVLHTSNCPYHQLTDRTNFICNMDMRLVSSLLGVVPRRIKHLAEGDESCSYFVPIKVAV